MAKHQTAAARFSTQFKRLDASDPITSKQGGPVIDHDGVSGGPEIANPAVPKPNYQTPPTVGRSPFPKVKTSDCPKCGK